MGVRVRVEIRHGDKVAETTALANSGYESDKPEVHIPRRLAELLGLGPGRSEVYRVVGGEVNVWRLGGVMVRVVTQDRKSRWVEAEAVLAEGEHEVLLSDSLIEELGIEILRPRRGLWRFAGEDTVRESAPAEYWPD